MDIAVTTTTTTLSTTIPAAPSATKPAHDITLYWLDQSRAQRIVWLLEETKLPYTTVVFHRQADLTAPPETRTIHPLGKLPMLNVDGTVYAESALIAEMVVDRFARWLQPNRDGSKDSEAAWWNYRYWIGFCEGSMLVPLLTALLNRGGDGERIKAVSSISYSPYAAREKEEEEAGKREGGARRETREERGRERRKRKCMGKCNGGAAS